MSKVNWYPPVINPPPPPHVPAPPPADHFTNVPKRVCPMSEEPYLTMEQVEHSSESNGIRASCEIQRTKQTNSPTEQSIWVTLDLGGQNLSNIEGDIRERIAELLNKCIRGIENP